MMSSRSELQKIGAARQQTSCRNSSLSSAVAPLRSILTARRMKLPPSSPVPSATAWLARYTWPNWPAPIGLSGTRSMRCTCLSNRWAGGSSRSPTGADTKPEMLTLSQFARIALQVPPNQNTVLGPTKRVAALFLELLRGFLERRAQTGGNVKGALTSTHAKMAV